MSWQQQVDGTLFDFGTVAETLIMKVTDELSLPYNPFTFDMTLRIIKSVQPYQKNLSFTISSGCKSVFGRKKQEVEYVLMAETVSSKHFAIDEEKKIYDLGSTKGTFIWIRREKQVQLEVGKIFLVGKCEIQIHKLVLNQRKIIVSIDNKLIELSTKQNQILFGSHQRCHIKIPGKQYYAAINIPNLRFYNLLENEDYDSQRGVWQRLSLTKKYSQGRSLEPEDLVMVYPYIFRVQY